MKTLAVYTTILISGMVVPHLNAEPCSVADFKGVYSFVAFGTVTSTNNPAGLPSGVFAAAGQTTYDGQGNASGVIQVSVNGTPLNDTWHGTYKVDPATCTTTKKLTLDRGPTLNFFITAGADFRELRFIATDMNVAVTGSARKQ